MFRFILATAIGYFLGKERKKRDKSGGSRTMALMCLSACVVAVISLDLQAVYQLDVLRLMQGGLQGISFIGMGLIVKNKGNVEGLTTASILFIVVLIGFLIGCKMYFYSFVVSGLAYTIGELKYWIEKGDS